MKPWVLLESAAIPGGGLMHLHQHGRDFSIRVGRDELMNSLAHGSEEALASLAAARLGRKPQLVLVGGLGMGFTAAAALRDLDGSGVLIVAELVSAVVAWNRGPLAHLAGDPLRDRRVQIAIEDVAAVMKRSCSTVERFDLILLDVDNGPQGMTSAGNHALYSQAGLAVAFQALRPGGVLAVWSAGPDAAFTRRLHAVGFRAELVQARSHGKRGSRQSIWLATRSR